MKQRQKYFGTQNKERKNTDQGRSHKTGWERTYQGHPGTDLGQPGTDQEQAEKGLPGASGNIGKIPT